MKTPELSICIANMQIHHLIFWRLWIRGPLCFRQLAQDIQDFPLHTFLMLGRSAVTIYKTSSPESKIIKIKKEKKGEKNKVNCNCLNVKI